MKAWAKSFYLSAAWEKTRAAYLMSQDYICERCGQPAKIVHHKRWLNRENINDISVTLCWDNLEALCQDCHNKEHHKQESSNRRVRKRVQAMAADTTTLTEKMRAALRISSTSEKITEEINDCIAACKADMKNDGVKVIKETDGLIIRAITLYCKAEFGFNNAAEQFRKSYDALKMRLSLSAEYNTAPQVSETDTNSTESGV